MSAADLARAHPAAAQVVLGVYVTFLVGAGIWLVIQLWRRR